MDSKSANSLCGSASRSGSGLSICQWSHQPETSAPKQPHPSQLNPKQPNRLDPQEQAPEQGLIDALQSGLHTPATGPLSIAAGQTAHN